MLSEPQGGHGSLSEALRGGEGQAEHQTLSARGRRGTGWGIPGKGDSMSKGSEVRKSLAVWENAKV